MNEKNLIPFQPGHDDRRNVKGRPKKIYTILRESGWSKSDYNDAFEEIGWQSIEDLKRLIDDPTKPAIIKVIANAFIQGADKGDFRFISEIMQHVIGSPVKKVEGLPETIEVTLNLGEVPPRPKTIDLSKIPAAEIVEPPKIDLPKDIFEVPAPMLTDDKPQPEKNKRWTDQGYPMDPHVFDGSDPESF